MGILSAATRGDLDRSPRFRELLRPRQIGAEMGGAFVVGGACWGACGIYRDRGRPDFTASDVRILDRVGPHIADGYRRALMLGALTQGEPGPGVALFDADGLVDSIDPVAEKHLSLIAPSPFADGPIVPVVTAVALRAQRGGQDMPAKARVRTTDGGWLVLYGTRMAGSDGRVAVLSEPAGPADLWPLVTAAYGLTARERDIAVACMRGQSTAEIAAAMFVSPYTVQDHLSSMFDKVGVRSRRALVARIFYDQYWSPVLQGQAPGSRGGFGRG